MCKDNSGKCGCGCQKCENKTTTRTQTTIQTQTALAPDSGYSKKTNNLVVDSGGSGYSKKSNLPVVADEILEPEVEVLEPIETGDCKPDYTGSIIAGVGLGITLLLAVFRERKK